MRTRLGINCFQTILRNKFVEKVDHNKIINNRKLNLFALIKNVQIFHDKMSINI